MSPHLIDALLVGAIIALFMKHYDLKKRVDWLAHHVSELKAELSRQVDDMRRQQQPAHDDGMTATERFLAKTAKRPRDEE